VQYPGLGSGKSWIAEIASSIDGISGLEQNALSGLFSRHAGQLPTTLTPALEARILEWSVNRKPRRLYPLEYLQARCPLGRQPHDGGAGVVEPCVATTSA